MLQTIQTTIVTEGSKDSQSILSFPSMAISVNLAANMSSLITAPRSTSQLNMLTPSASYKNLQKCYSTPSNITLSSSIFSGSFRSVPVMISSSSFSSGQRRGFLCSSTQKDSQNTGDPLVENNAAGIDTEVIEQIIEDSSEEEVSDQDSAEGETEDELEENPTSVVMESLQLYKEALLNNDKSKVDEIESSLLSIEQEKESLTNEVTGLSAELLSLKDKVLRISADFDNYRKRTERDRLSLVTNAQGEVVESLLPVLDNFERAKAQIKLETDGEEKINNSYQSIYKQFGEVLASLGVVPVETVGKPFDPMLHEAIMREDSSEFEEGIILQEFRKGFQLGDRLLRPSMVKVSAGPGPTKPKETETPGDAEAENESSEAEESS